MEVLKCANSKCGQLLPGNVRFCGYCGHQMRCADCGEIVARFCGGCGKPRVGILSAKDLLLMEFINEVCEDDGTLLPARTDQLLSLLDAKTPAKVEELIKQFQAPPPKG